MKALDLLKNIDRKCCTDRVNGLLDLAIKELEELENRSCDTCKSKFCSIKRILTREDEINSNYFYCNDWEK